MAFIAPAGVPLSLGDLVAGAYRGLSRAAKDRLVRGLCVAGARENSWLLSTGRAAMTVAFSAMKHSAGDPRRVEVICPGYTCYSVPAAIERAGLLPRICDVDPATLSPDLGSLADVDFRRVLAIVSANLYGLPNSLEEIETLARSHGVFMLDDAAQALGARHRGRPAGNFGDVGLYSFDKGKNITTLQGGGLVADSGKLSVALEAAMAGVQGVPPSGTLATLLKLPVYALLLRPWLYGAARRLPLGLGLTPYDTEYPIAPYSRVFAGLAVQQLERLDEINGARIGNAARLREALAGLPGLSIPSVLPGAEPVYVRFPVLADATRRGDLIEALEQAGIGATASYPAALVDVPEVACRLARDQRPTPGARDIASRIVTLPTHGHSPPDLAQRVFAVGSRILAK